MPAIEPREFIGPYDPLGEALAKPIRGPKTQSLRRPLDQRLSTFRRTNRIPTPKTRSLAIAMSHVANDLAGDDFMPGMGDADFLPGMGEADFLPGMGDIDDNGMLPGMGDLGYGHGGHGHGGHGGGRGGFWAPVWGGSDNAYLETNIIQPDEAITYRGYVITCTDNACKVNRIGDSTVLTVVANANEARDYVDRLAGGVNGIGDMSASFMPGMGDADFLPGMGEDPTLPKRKRSPSVRNITPPIGINQTPAIATKSPRWKNVSLRKPLGRPLLGRATNKLPIYGGSMLPGLSHDDLEEDSPEIVGAGCVGEENLYDEIDGFGADVASTSNANALVTLGTVALFAPLFLEGKLSIDKRTMMSTLGLGAALFGLYLKGKATP